MLRGLGGGTIDTDEENPAESASKDGEGEQTRAAARKEEKGLRSLRTEGLAA